MTRQQSFKNMASAAAASAGETSSAASSPAASSSAADNSAADNSAQRAAAVPAKMSHSKIPIENMVGDSPQASNVKGTISKTRRRLTVISDNKFADGLKQKLSILDDDPSENKTTTNVVGQYAGVCKKGYAPYNPRKQNQDSIIMEEDPKTKCLLFAALDGHGELGDHVSQYIRDRLPKMLFSHEQFPKNVGAALTDCIAILDNEVNKVIDTKFSGTTAVICTIIGNVLTCANVGDSRIILGMVNDAGQLVVDEVSEDHKPDSPAEQKRIEQAGGRVFAVTYEDGIDGPARVWLAKIDIPGLAMSRSLGDTVAHSVGVSSIPDIITKTIGPQHKFLVMGSDGLWEFISNEETLKVASKYATPKDACDVLVKEAYQRWMQEEQVVDDTTVLIAHF